jgi:hypothetical protein
MTLAPLDATYWEAHIGLPGSAAFWVREVSSLAVIIVVIVGLAAAACANALYTRRNREDSLERHERALNALRELNEHPHPEPEPIHEELPTDHVKILEERPVGAMPQRRRARRAASARRMTARSRPRGVASRPTAAQLPRTPSSAPPLPPDEHPEPPRIEVPATPIVFDDGVDEPVATPAPSRMPRARRLSVPAVPRSVAIAVAVALVAVLVASVTAFVVTDQSSSSGTRGRSASPPASIKTTTTTPPPTVTTTLPKPTAQFTASASGNGTVTVAVPFTLTLTATTASCWVRVDDASGHTLFTGTLKPGEQQQVPGTGPLTVRLGNSPAIQMSVNGAPLNLAGVANTANVQFQPTT